MTTHTASRPPAGDVLLFQVGVGLLVLGWSAPNVAALVWSGTGWTPTDVTGLAEAYGNLFRPERIAGAGLAGPWFGATTLTLIVAALTGAVCAAVRRQTHRRAELSGLASRTDLRRLSRKSLLASSNTIIGRSTDNPEEVGLLVGRERHTRSEVWLSKESTVLVLAPPRAGKTTGIVAPAVADHHGPVIVTGVRHDVLELTHAWRQRFDAPLYLCEPMLDDHFALPTGVQRVRWSPLAGCDDYLTAQLRSEAFFAAIPKGGSNDEFWRAAGQQLLAGYLMAAAVSDARITDVVRWVDRSSDLTPAELLRTHAASLDGDDASTVTAVAGQLEAAIGQDPRYKAGVTGQAQQAIAPFRVPQIRGMCDVPVAESFDARQFLERGATIWMLGSESEQSQAAGVCTALTAAIIEEARRLARATPGGRLQPPLLAALDEVVNTAPVPRLEQLLATGGGSGIQTIVVLQSMAAARNKWGRELGDALLDFNNAKIVLGGLSDAQDLADLSTLLGQRDERVIQTSHSGRVGVLEANDYSWSWRQVPVMRPDEIRSIDSEHRHEALLITRAAKGVLIRQQRIYERTPPHPGTHARRRKTRRT